MYIYIYIYIFDYIYTYIYIYIYIHIHTHLSLSLSIYIYIYICTHIHTLISYMCCVVVVQLCNKTTTESLQNIADCYFNVEIRLRCFGFLRGVTTCSLRFLFIPRSDCRGTEEVPRSGQLQTK